MLINRLQSNVVMRQNKNSNSVMETRNHFKNGASPKSHMSRGNQNG